MQQPIRILYADDIQRFPVYSQVYIVARYIESVLGKLQNTKEKHSERGIENATRDHGRIS